ncbi:hypothetical protein CR513_02989, partial [Mucuna pruriens]
TLFSELYITLPFTALEQLVLCALNIAPSQLHPNNEAFELLSEDLGREPSLGVFFWFFSTRRTEKVGWTSLSNRHGRQLMKPFREAVLEGEVGSSILFDAFGNSFPLYWSDQPVVSIIVGWDELEDWEYEFVK